MKVLGWLFFGLVLVAIGLPMVWVVFSSIRPSVDILGSPFGIPKSPQWSNYLTAWSEAKIGRSAFNSAVVSLISLGILLPIGSMAAYVLARMEFRGRGILASLFSAGLMFPNFLAVVPLFLLMSRLNLTESLHGLIIVYVSYSLSFTIFVMSGFFKMLPKDLEEASQLDGCTLPATFWRIMLPLARPGLVVAGLFNFIGLWNEYNLAKVMVSGDNATLPIGLANLTVAQFYKNDYGALFAALTLVMIPLIVVYWLLREKVHSAMLAGAIK